VLSDAAAAELRRTLLAAARRSCPSWMRGQLEDIVQTAMTRVLSRSMPVGSLPASYFHRMGYTAVVDEMRRQFRRREVAVGDRNELDRLPQAVDDRPSPGTDVETGRAIWDCMARLIPPRRCAVAFHLQGYSAPETARQLGWTAKKTGHLVQRGLRDLRECLKKKGIEP
jgi:DNA-directed RNA polymerase specialized sigma24 family protein